MEVFNMLSNIAEFAQQFLKAGTFAILNHILQAYFFTMTLSNIISFGLRLVEFNYLKEGIASNWAVQIVGVMMMWSIKIWDYYSGVLYIASIFSLAIVSIYVYDCCANISERFDSWRENHRDLALILSFFLMFLTTAYLLYSIHTNTQNPMQYEYSGIYLLIVLIVLVGNIVRNRSVLYSLIGILIMNYLIATRYIITNKVSDSMLAFAEIPWATTLYFLMALQAEKTERNKTGSDKFMFLFMACVSLSAYSLLNNNNFPLELVLGGVYIFGIIINR